MLSRSLGMPSRNDRPPSIWDTHGTSGNVFANPTESQQLIRQSRIHGSLLYQNTHHHMWWVKAKHQLWIRDASQDRQPEIHSSLVREDFQIIMEQTNLNYADLFTIGLRNDDVQEFDSKWDGILLSMTKIPLDDILEGLYKLRIREFEKLKTVLELYDIITDWKQWWKEVSSRTYEIWILAPEMEIKKETPWSRIREQNSVYRDFLEIVGNGSPKGSVLEETIAVSDTTRISVEKRHSQIRLRILSCSRMREMRREPKVREAKKRVVECFDGFARTTSKELAPIHSVKSGTLQNVVLQDQEWLQIWRKVLVCPSSGWWTT